MTDIVERLIYADRFLMDPISLKPALRNPDGPEAAEEITRLRKHAEAMAVSAVEAVIPLEALLLSGTYQSMCPEMQEGIRNGVMTVRKNLAAYRAEYPDGGEG